jgi:hypothetical protein
MTVQNITPSITPSDGIARPQNTSGPGTLVAVLRYRQNACLQLPTLQGSPYYVDGSGTVAWSEFCRQPSRASQSLPQVVVSDRIPAPADMSSPQVVTFQFADALPFYAIDVDLQVIYRGPLGTESDSIAIGFEHINEPTFFNFDNNSDCMTQQLPACSTAQPPSSCFFSDEVKLPFPEAAAAPGWRTVAKIQNLAPGQYARVAFLTRSGFREAPPRTLEVVTNQDFPYDIIVTYTDGSTVTWPAGPTIRNPMELSRPLSGQPPANMLAWWGHGFYNIATVNGITSQFAWASTCPAIDPAPQPVQIMFP